MNTTTADPLAGLQAEVIALRKKIQTERERLLPLREKMDQVYLEYELALRPLASELNRLRRVAAARLAPPEPMVTVPTPSGGGNTGPNTIIKPTLPVKPPPPNLQQRKDKLQKEQVLEYLVWALDDQTSRANQVLLSHVTELNEQPAVTLADLLEAIPVDLFGMQTYQEASGDVNARRARLLGWKEALEERIRALAGEEARLYSRDQYFIFQQYQQGPGAWQAFLSREKQRIQSLIDQQAGPKEAGPQKAEAQ